eukprot:TRINITY_DN11067_c0_g1_i1.p1 TRINITY_DN11067_c0_g1~~TRINITY_DN11067_c0_g1_i1.p1  ORF type:complete len:66 (+),score=6.63 TRINITY_DN11067_c0_g1_i1:325-522(+)
MVLDIAESFHVEILKASEKYFPLKNYRQLFNYTKISFYFMSPTHSFSLAGCQRVSLENTKYEIQY